MRNEVVYKDKKYEIKLDKKYGYYRLFPLPTKEELKEYYKKEFYGKKYNKQINDSSRKNQEEELEFLNMQYGDILDIIKEEAPGKKIFDIGCGYGNFLKFCQERGFEVLGIDSASNAIKCAKARGINVFEAEVEDIKHVTKEKYQAVVMLNVLEHLREPYKVLTYIKDHILQRGGLLVIRVPNDFNMFQLIANQEYNLNYWWVSPPQHINYFTVNHLEQLVKKCGYEVFLKESTFPLEMFILFGEQYVGNPKIGKNIHKKRVFFEKTLQKYNNTYKRKIFQIFAKKELGREIILYSRKK